MPGRYAAVDVRDLSKTFHVPRQHMMTLKERALHPFRRAEFDELHVLREVSFQVLEGEFFGIVGRNGSGKSTLLKCLAGIYRGDAGHIRIAGRLAPFIELGVGFNPELTAHDNVVINGVMMGLSPAQARERFDDVIAFAELEDFLDLKLKNYSSGMQVRLAFSLMVHSDAEMLLIDEVLAVGDAAFQQKCLDVFYRLRDEGRTIVLVTHDMGMIDRFCHRALLLEDGRVEMSGDPHDVGRRYLELNFERRGEVPGAKPQDGDAVTIADVWVEDAAGERASAVVHGEPFHVCALIDVHERIERPDVHLTLNTDEALAVFTAATSVVGAPKREPFLPGERISVRVRAENPLGDARYFVDCSVHGAERGLVSLRARACQFMVFGGAPHAGMVELEHTIEVERALERVS
jgi:ABC-2 type transport system ATP-binding protein